MIFFYIVKFSTGKFLGGREGMLQSEFSLGRLLGHSWVWFQLPTLVEACFGGKKVQETFKYYLQFIKAYIYNS